MWQDFPWLVVVVADLWAEPHEYDLRMGYHHFGMSSDISEVQVSPLTMFFDDKLSGWWFQPLCKILVSWDDYSQYMEKYLYNVPNHQSVNYLCTLSSTLPHFESLFVDEWTPHPVDIRSIPSPDFTIVKT